MRIAVLASGTGTILEALLSAHLPIELVVVDRKCQAIEIAARAGIPCAELIRSDFTSRFDRSAYSDELVATLKQHAIDLVVMAGFGTVFGPSVLSAYRDRILNTHPALLPAFKGWYAVEQALAAGVKITGCTVHVATLEVDEGLILAQEAVPVLPGDTRQSLHERIKEVERRLYPATIKRVITQLANGETLS